MASSVGALGESESVDIVSAGKILKETSSAWKPVLIFSALENDRGQVACLLSIPSGYRGIVRREVCLRCCPSAA